MSLSKRIHPPYYETHPSVLSLSKRIHLHHTMRHTHLFCHYQNEFTSTILWDTPICSVIIKTNSPPPYYKTHPSVLSLSKRIHLHHTMRHTHLFCHYQNEFTSTILWDTPICSVIIKTNSPPPYYETHPSVLSLSKRIHLHHTMRHTHLFCHYQNEFTSTILWDTPICSVIIKTNSLSPPYYETHPSVLSLSKRIHLHHTMRHTHLFCHYQNEFNSTILWDTPICSDYQNEFTSTILWDTPICSVIIKTNSPPPYYETHPSVLSLSKRIHLHHTMRHTHLFCHYQNEFTSTILWDTPICSVIIKTNSPPPYYETHPSVLSLSKRIHLHHTMRHTHLFCHYQNEFTSTILWDTPICSVIIKTNSPPPYYETHPSVMSLSKRIHLHHTIRHTHLFCHYQNEFTSTIL